MYNSIPMVVSGVSNTQLIIKRYVSWLAFRI